jgi:hypothetical protein
MYLTRLLACLALLVLDAHAGADSPSGKGKEAEARLTTQADTSSKAKPSWASQQHAGDPTATAEHARAASDDARTARISQADAAQGIKGALAQGMRAAITQLGREDGFRADQAVRIGTPQRLRELAEIARQLGAGKYVEQFETAMNRAAEAAVPLAADSLADAVHGLTFEDATAVLRGGDSAATAYLREQTGARLREQFLPVVARTSAEAGVAQCYARLIEKAGEMGNLLGSSEVDLDQYVTDRAVDGLFHYLAEQEQAIRANPLGQSSSQLQRVFGGR